MKHLRRSFKYSFSAAAIFAGFSWMSSDASAAVETYTNQTDFFNALAGPAYFESFSALNGKIEPSPQAFSFGGDSFTLNDNDPNGIYYSSTGSFGQASVYPTPYAAADSFTITFPSDNITAFGGTFFLTDVNYNPIADGDVTVTLSTGQSIVLASTDTYSTEPFAGFTSSIPIDSITVTGPTLNDDDEYSFISFDNFYLGQSDVVPEPESWALLLAGMTALMALRFRAGRRSLTV